uniref:Centromere/kinetochore protein zw10 N-terminal domain-containing protein n=1 Tax=Seriola lalandi dorsalis TaxID=1841481 RepID=A0A3B4XS34_SERLL
MASFVTEVLASSGKLEKEDLSSKISKMSRKVEDTKEEVCDMINKRYGDFLPSLQGSEDLMVQVDDVSKEMDVLKNCIENEVCIKLFINSTRSDPLLHRSTANCSWCSRHCTHTC